MVDLAKRAAKTRTRWLKGQFSKAEHQLERLTGDPHAWKVFWIVDAGWYRGFGAGVGYHYEEATKILGVKFEDQLDKSVADSRPWSQIKSQAAALIRKKPVLNFTDALTEVCKKNPKLYTRYAASVIGKRRHPNNQEARAREAWAAAKTAVFAHAALVTQDPLKQKTLTHALSNHLHGARQLSKYLKRAVVMRKVGKSRKGKETQFRQLIHRAHEHARQWLKKQGYKRSVSSSDVIKLLTNNTDRLEDFAFKLDIDTEFGIQPDGKKIWYRTLQGKEKCIGLKTLDNITARLNNRS